MTRGEDRSAQLDQPETIAAPLEAAWESIRAGLRRDLGARTFDGWLKPAEVGPFDAESGELAIVMPSQFMADWVRGHFGERLNLAWRATLPLVREVRIAAALDAPKPSPLLVLEEIPAPPEPALTRDPNAPNFDARYRFETFIIGKANEVAASAARTLATADKVAFNPLFIHGGTGRGKTHLLHAIGQAFLSAHPAARVVSMSAERFMVMEPRSALRSIEPRSADRSEDTCMEPQPATSSAKAPAISGNLIDDAKRVFILRFPV